MQRFCGAGGEEDGVDSVDSLEGEEYAEGNSC